MNSQMFWRNVFFATLKWGAGAGSRTTEAKGWGSEVLAWCLGLGLGKAKRYELGRTSWRCRNSVNAEPKGVTYAWHCHDHVLFDWGSLGSSRSNKNHESPKESETTQDECTGPWTVWGLRYVSQSLRSILRVFIRMCAFRGTTAQKCAHWKRYVFDMCGARFQPRKATR